MIRDGRFIIDLPEDWKKVIRALRTRPMYLHELRNETGIDLVRLKEILKTMRLLNMVSYKYYKDEIKLIERADKYDKLH